MQVIESRTTYHFSMKSDNKPVKCINSCSSIGCGATTEKIEIVLIFILISVNLAEQKIWIQ